MENINENKISLRMRAFFIGLLIIVAYGTIIYGIVENPLLAMIVEIISGLAVIGAALLLFPILKPHGAILTWSYTILKFLEGICIIIGALLFIPMIMNPELSGESIIANRDLLGVIIEIIFALRFSILAVLYFKSRLVPRFIAIWGLIAAIIMIVSALVNLVAGADLIPQFISHPLVILNEIFLAFWLMIKGFNRV